MKLTFALAAILGITVCETSAQSTIRVRNNTWQDFNVEVVQSSGTVVDGSQWLMLNDTVLGWWETDPIPVFQVNRTNAAVPDGETAVFDIKLRGATDTLTLQMKLEGVANGTAMQFSIAGPGIEQPWSDGPDFEELTTTLAGKNVVIKYRPDNDDASQQRNVFFTIHDLPIYELAAEDLENPNVMNAMFYNIQMLPFAVSGMGQANDRADLLPAQLSPYQDVVVFEELFDDSPREDHMIPAMEAAGFPYHTEILNPNNSIIPIPWNGGVIIFSRWPIEFEDDYNFELCGQASQDCLANKGIKYARINKLGKKYHIFGTHMDAGGEADDILAKRTQMGEIRDFIDVQSIPDGEPVIFGGDFNVAPTHGMNLYPAMLDSIGPYIPHAIGYHNSTFDGVFGKIIDNAWGDRSHLVALESTNEVITMRSIEPVLWDLGEFSDHRSALGRFVYPDISMVAKGDTVICPGTGITMQMESSIPVTYQWTKDGEPLDGETFASFSIADGQPSQSGQYACVVGYEVIYGNVDDSLTAVFYPNGPDTVRSSFVYEFGNVTIDQILCEVGIDDMEPLTLQISPNPSTGMFMLSGEASLMNADILVVDMLGKTVSRPVISSGNAIIDLSAQPSGVYVLKISHNGRSGQQRLSVVR